MFPVFLLEAALDDNKNINTLGSQTQTSEAQPNQCVSLDCEGLSSASWALSGDNGKEILQSLVIFLFVP